MEGESRESNVRSDRCNFADVGLSGAVFRVRSKFPIGNLSSS